MLAGEPLVLVPTLDRGMLEKAGALGTSCCCPGGAEAGLCFYHLFLFLPQLCQLAS